MSCGRLGHNYALSAHHKLVSMVTRSAAGLAAGGVPLARCRSTAQDIADGVAALAR